MDWKIAYQDLGKLDLFNTPYKVKFRGIVGMQDADFYIIETHGQMYALEKDNNWEVLYIHENINTSEYLEYIKRNATICLTCSGEELIIESKDDPFKSNVFSIEVEGYPFEIRRFECKYKLPEHRFSESSVDLFLEDIAPDIYKKETIYKKEDALDNILLEAEKNCMRDAEKSCKKSYVEHQYERIKGFLR